jgi:uncharacterized protein YjbI with pentapeptide repeats
MVRLSQAEVLSRYQAGDRDFRGADLSCLQFRGEILAGADFSGADLRGTDFQDADLRGVKFVGARCGVPWLRGLLGHGLIGLAMGNLAWLTVLIQTWAIVEPLFIKREPNLTQLGAWVDLLVLFWLVVTARLAWEGISEKRLSFLYLFSGAAMPCSVAAAVAGSSEFTKNIARVVAVTGFVVSTGLTAALVARAGASNGEVFYAIAVACILFSSVIISWQRSRRGAIGYERIRSFGIALGSLGGTRFSGADLRGSFFTDTALAQVSFVKSRQRATLLEWVCWKGAQKVDLAYIRKTILAEPRIRSLLISGSAFEADLHGLNLRGAHLPQADMRGADLRETNLSEAVLSEAHLEGANLKASQCLGTDLEGAHLTGATLEGWNIDHATNLHAVDCAYVYLLEPFDALGQRRDDHHRERLPHDPEKSFGPGDFETYFKQMIEEVKLLIKNGVDAKAFQQALQEVMRQHPQITPASITGLKKSGNDVLVMLQAPVSEDKGQVEQTFFAKYNAVLLENARLKGLLAGERRVAEVERERATQFAELASLLAPAIQSNPYPTTVVNTTIHAGDGNLINTGSLNTAGGMVNLGALSDQARITIEALPEHCPDEGQPSLRELLQELKASVDGDSHLPEETRAEALTEVTELANAAQDPEKNVGPARRAIKALKRLSAGISETNKAVEESSQLMGAIKRLLPLIAAFFVG